MGLIEKLFKRTKEKDKKLKFSLKYEEKYIEITLKLGDEIISLKDLKGEVGVSNLSKTDIFEIDSSGDKLLLEYNEVYNLDRLTLRLLKLPKFFPGLVYIDNKGYFGSSKVEFEYTISLGIDKYIIVNGNYIESINNPEKYVLTKEQYDLIKLIVQYNNDSNKNKEINEQYRMLNAIKDISHKTNLLLNETMKKEDELLLLENIELDFLESDEDYLEVVPQSSQLSKEQNENLRKVFKSANLSQDFYLLNIDNKKVKVVVNRDLKDALKVVKSNEKISKKDFVKRESPVFDIDSKNVEYNYGPRVIGLGYLNYRPSPAPNISEMDWFSKEFPKIMTDRPIILKPEHLSYMQDKFNNLEDFEETELKFDVEGDEKKLFISKENLANEIKKLENSIKEITDYNKAKTLDEIIEIAEADNYSQDYIAYKGNYIRKFDKEVAEQYRDDLREIEIEKRENKKNTTKDQEKVLLPKDNIETLDYTEDIEKIKEEKVELPNSLRYSEGIELKEHQKEGLLRIQSLYKKSNVNGLLLCDDMGLGKTIQILSFLAWLKEKEALRPSLLIMPTSLITNWYDEKNIGEIQKFFLDDTFKVKILDGKKSREEIAELRNYDLVLTSYESLRINHKETGYIEWKVVVCDEAQKMKNPKTLLTTAIKTQNALFKIACSATPIENTVVDLWCLTDFVKPGLLESQKDFEQKYMKPLSSNDINDNKRREINNKLSDLLGEFYLRREKEKVLSSDFPKKIVIYDKIKPSSQQEEIIENLKNTGKAALAVIQGMIMTCSHPQLVDRDVDEVPLGSEESLIEEAYKLAHIHTILTKVKEKNEKAIIFTKYRKMQKILWNVIKYWFEIEVGIINGDADKSARRRVLDEFRKKEGFNVIILSPEAAGVGLNIVEANHVIHYTRHWNPAKEEQATDRAYRIGQKKDVYVYYPIISNVESIEREEYHTVDEWIKKQLEVDMTDSSPEEKLNRIIVKKKRMLKDFFLTCGGEFDDDMAKEFAAMSNGVEKDLSIEVIDNIAHQEFEKLAVVLLEKEYNSKYGLVTVESGDKGIDGLIFSEKGNILIQAKHTKRLDTNAAKELFYGEKIYSKTLNRSFPKLIVFTSASKNNISEDIKKMEKDGEIEIYHREKLTELLNKYPTKITELLDKDVRYSIEDIKRYIKTMQI
ncbi:SNF2-related protein [Fusobacterium sp.]|uniref:Helicase SNF2 n=1 Tax=Fusobacterium nucleatum TaxID=851 RepID=A0A323U0N2_FUSNU|nr:MULTISPECIES: SNF2-related protein [Fusobacterium]PCR85304.1 helicase SNF2 [Fusobacterium nucleatum]PZA04266.1 helicase SNF2 [Fusobacterium nucleatum]QJX51292.1 DEAD/DEAH box helicase family protein [Fusobacterium nucleatum]HCE31833.1 helicase SNF2 [Fusobacterium sp.]